MPITDNRSAKITEVHLQKIAYVYLRQSSMGQVRTHTESTERQYALQELARQSGWNSPRIVILDGDLGKSGVSTTDREDFKSLVTNVSLGKAGAVLAIEASRLARSNADWHRLIEICGVTGTLIIDEDGCYDPGDFNDGLLLGLKGTMAQAELHFIRTRLLTNKLNKARKGELRVPLPIGYVYDELNQVVKDPDAQVRSSLELVFSYFQQCGSAYGVVQRFTQEKLGFPKRTFGGTWAGKLLWKRLSVARANAILKNPSYAGVYAFGRHRSIKGILENGEVGARVSSVPEENWLVNLPDHHEGYISFEQYTSNLGQLARNQSVKERVLSGPAREGLALLQGLLICGCCGRRLSPRYQGNGGIYPKYQCTWRKREGFSKSVCMSVPCPPLDRVIEERVLEVLSSEQLELALSAFDIVCQRNDQIDAQWKMRLQRAEYESQLAQRRYEEVDPSNRLVASTLEQRWNDSLIELQDVKDQIDQMQQQSRRITEQQRAEVLELAENLPKLWHNTATAWKDKKRILQLLISDITVQKQEQCSALLQLRWQGGASEEIRVDLSRSKLSRQRHSEALIARVTELTKTMDDAQIAACLNDEGLTTAKGVAFTIKSIQRIRRKHAIAGADDKKAGEISVKELARRVGVSVGVVYGWIDKGVISGRRLNAGSPYLLAISPEIEQELAKRACQANRTKTL
ncbi:MAG: recombinase family protein [Planctomycetales bacterium]|nr:recombinase family protein [Planctomycetales bacterium]